MPDHFISPVESKKLSRKSVRKFSVGLELLYVSAYAFSRADGNPPRHFGVVGDEVSVSAGYRLIRLILLESMPTLQAKYWLFKIVKIKRQLYS